MGVLSDRDRTLTARVRQSSSRSQQRDDGRQARDSDYASRHSLSPHLNGLLGRNKPAASSHTGKRFSTAQEGSAADDRARATEGGNLLGAEAAERNDGPLVEAVVRLAERGLEVRPG